MARSATSGADRSKTKAASDLAVSASPGLSQDRLSPDRLIEIYRLMYLSRRIDDRECGHPHVPWPDNFIPNGKVPSAKPVLLVEPLDNFSDGPA